MQFRWNLWPQLARAQQQLMRGAELREMLLRRGPNSESTEVAGAAIGVNIRAIVAALVRTPVLKLIHRETEIVVLGSKLPQLYFLFIIFLLAFFVSGPNGEIAFK